MRSYGAARSLFSFLAFIAWSIIVIGVVVALVGAASGSQYGGGGTGVLGMAPGIVIGIAGFILVAFVQMGRATVDTAEYTQQMLQLSRDQLEVSRQGLKAQAKSPKKFEATAQKEVTRGHKISFADQATKTHLSESETDISDPGQPMDESTIYKRKTIWAEQGKYIVNGNPFETLLAAKEFIDSIAGSPVKSLPSASRKT